MPPHETQPKKYEPGLSFVYSIFGIMNYTLCRGSYKVVDAQYSYWKFGHRLRMSKNVLFLRRSKFPDSVVDSLHVALQRDNGIRKELGLTPFIISEVCRLLIPDQTSLTCRQRETSSAALIEFDLYKNSFPIPWNAHEVELMHAPRSKVPSPGGTVNPDLAG